MMGNEMPPQSAILKDNATDNSSHQYLTFNIENKLYCFDIRSVKEIRGYMEITQIPDSIEFMMGVINIRGTIIPVFDLKLRFNAGATKKNARKVIIIAAVENQYIGVLVDSVADIITVDHDDIKSPVAAQTAINREFIKGIIIQQDKMVVALDISTLFGKDSLKNLQTMNKKVQND